LLIEDGRMKIESGNMDSLISQVVENHGDYFEQLLLVKNGAPNYNGNVLMNGKVFVGRAIVEFKENIFAVIQTKNTMNRKDFSDALADIGVVNAIYTDMGSWSYGWYRDSKNRLIPLSSGDKMRQTNWLIFREIL